MHMIKLSNWIPITPMHLAVKEGSGNYQDALLRLIMHQDIRIVPPLDQQRIDSY